MSDTIDAGCLLLKNALDLDTHPVAVYLDKGARVEPPYRDWRKLEKHRYCQALMRARSGEQVVLEGGEIACPAAAAAFGMKPLPPGLMSGDGLVGFGIVKDPATGRAMFEAMPRLPAGSVQRLALSPLERAPARPDVVVVEGEPEKLMWLLLADLNLAGGARRAGSTAVLQATCVDATVIPHLQQRMNFCLGCYGCREATDLAPGEAVLGFPGSMLEPIVEMVTYLREKAMPRSRAKAVYKRLAASMGDASAGEKKGEVST